MALSDLFRDLDPKLAGVLEQTTRALRDEFDEKLARAMSQGGDEEEGAVDLAQEAPEAPETVTADTAEADEDRALPEPAVSDLLDPVEELKHAVAAIDASSSQSEILEALIAGCARFSSRVAVFLLRGGDAFGWNGHGFDASPDDFKKTRVAIEPESAWAQLAGGSGAVALTEDECRPITDLFSAPAPQMGLLLPFVLGNQPAAAIYCDRLAADETPRISALQILTFVASQVLENLPVRDREHTATLRLSDAGAAAVVDAPAEVISEPEPPALPVESELPPIEAPEPTEDEPPAEPEVEVAPEPTFEPVDEPAPSEPDEEAPLEEEMAPTVEEELPEPATDSELDSPPAAPSEPTPPVARAESTTQVAPPDDVKGPGWAFTAGAGAEGESAEGADHEEARRLARLLVTEIKLYNEEQVEQGRQKGNVYSLLREDIDRSRQIFEDRIDDGVRGAKDYFREACIRILAGGDPATLGF